MVWVAATSRQAVVDAYARAAADIGLRTDPGDRKQAAAAFLAWLEPKPAGEPCRWLVILDALADPGHLDSLWPPVHPLGRTLVTTRRDDASLGRDGRLRFAVGPFTPEEATRHLASHFPGADPADLAAIAGQQAPLPGGLARTVTFLEQTGLSCADYRTLLTHRPGPPPDPDDPGSPLGLLHFASLLDQQGFPAALFEIRCDAPEAAADALRVLRRLHLITYRSDGRHPLIRVEEKIHRAAHAALPGGRHDALARAAAEALYATCSAADIERDAALAPIVLANAHALYHHTSDIVRHPAAGATFNQARRTLRKAGRAGDAVRHFRCMTRAARERVGSDHADTLLLRQVLARSRSDAGELQPAIDAFTELLSDQERLLGPHHAHTLATRLDLALNLRRAGNLPDAIARLGDLLTHREAQLGPDHPHVLAIRETLGQWRARQRE